MTPMFPQPQEAVTEGPTCEERVALALSVLAHRPLTPQTAALLERVLRGLDLGSLTAMEV